MGIRNKLVLIIFAFSITYTIVLIMDQKENVEKTFEKENEEREALAAGMPIDEVYRVFSVL